MQCDSVRVEWVTLVSCVLAVAGCVFAPCPAAADDAPVAPVAYNEAEAIIEPFWTTELSGFEHWTVDQGDAHGLAIRQNWAAVDYEWASRPESGPALRMSRRFNVDCRRYDRLVVRVVMPRAAVLRVIASTDKEKITFVSEPATGDKGEYALDLEGAERIDTITLEIEAGQDGPAGGWLRWIGLQSTDRLEDYFARWDFSNKRWDEYIQDETYRPTFKPAYGIFLTEDELEAMRAEHADAVKADGESGYTRLAEAARGYHPEQGIHEFADSGGRTTSHSRVRDEHQPRLEGSTRLAEAGLVLEDAAALRMAARYALSLAMCEHWETGFMSSFPGGPWEDRAFRRSYTCNDIAVILDLAGEIFTDTGRLYLMRRLAEEGVGPINFVTWRHEYIFHCNQLAYFNTGRMYAYLVIEREWPRVKPYTDLAYQDTINSLGYVIEPDGGYFEGPGYFGATVRENYYALKQYARARGMDLDGIVPDVLRQTGNYAAVIASTTDDDVIPICDSGPSFRGDSLKILTELSPDSYWVTMYNKQQRLRGEPPLDREGPPLPAFIALPETGPLASHRKLGDHLVKIFVMGHKNGADHTHEDKGSFVLEFAGQTFAMDLGMCEYDDPIHHAYKQCQRHNMLAPVGTPERAHPERPLLVDVKPVGQGDETTFHATIDATAGWNGFFEKWVRTWDSPSPERLVIRDDYVVGKGDGVEFYWQTKLPCEIKDNTVVITGDNGIVTLEIPDDCTVRVETLPLIDDGHHQRITVHKPARQGTLEITATLSLR